MLDTNICVYAIKNKPEVIRRIISHKAEEICISSITYSELMYGVEKSIQKEKNRIALTLFLSNIQIIDFDAKAAECYGKIKAGLEKQGNIIGTMDMLIAAHGLSKDFTVVTNNLREFERVDGLMLENWAI